MKKIKLTVKVWKSGNRLFLKLPKELTPELEDLRYVDIVLFLPDE